MILVFGFGFWAFASGATTFTVTKESDDDGQCEVDDCALREAILSANATPGNDIVVVPGGTYQLSLIGTVEENQSMTGDLDLLDDVEIRGDQELPVVIVGDGTDRVIQIFGCTVIISNLTITGGMASSWGGGIRATNSRVTIINSTISGNMNSASGGGILAGPPEMTLINCTVSQNTTQDHGGGIFRFGIAGIDPANLTLINTTVSGNLAVYVGGGIFNAGGVTWLYSTQRSRITHHIGEPPFLTTTLLEAPFIPIPSSWRHAVPSPALPRDQTEVTFRSAEIPATFRIPRTG